MVIASVTLLWLVLPLSALGMAGLATERGWGLFNHLDIPPALEFVAGFLLLDLGIYLQHVATHHVPLLWRLHRMHHCDPEFDTTTGVRFHPLEILLSMLYKFALIATLGITWPVVLAFEIVLNSTALFNHGNLAIPTRIDAILRWVVVTPDVHRVHHSTLPRETNSNFGFNLTLWDRLFGTWTDQPNLGHEAMHIGLDAFPGDSPTRFWWCLRLPFSRPGRA